MIKALFQLFSFLLKEIIVQTAKGLWDSRPWKKQIKLSKCYYIGCRGKCDASKCQGDQKKKS